MKQILLTILLGALVLPAQRTPEVERLLKQAANKELVDGDLQGAIQAYRQALAKAGTNRAAAAKALLGIALCHEKLGDAEARKAYERLVAEYGDQQEAGQARLRLARLGGAGRSGTRLLWSSTENACGEGDVSPDGKWMSCADYTTPSLGIRDLATGEYRQLVSNGPWNQSGVYFSSSAFSPDGKWIAYAATLPSQKMELRVVAAAGGAERVVLRDLTWFQVDGWTPDGKSVFIEAAGPYRFSLVSVADGKETVVRRAPKHEDSDLLRISPDGKWFVYNAPDEQGGQDLLFLSVSGGEPLRLRHPATELTPQWLPDGSGIVFLSDRSGEMGLWTLAVRDGKPQGVARLVRSGLGNWQLRRIDRNGGLYYHVRVPLENAWAIGYDGATGKVTGTPARLTELHSGYQWSSAFSRKGRIATVVGMHYARAKSGMFLLHGDSVSGPFHATEVKELLWNRYAGAFFEDEQHVLVPSGRCDGCPFGLAKFHLQTGATEILTTFGKEVNRLPISSISTVDGKRFYFALQASGRHLYRYDAAQKKAERVMTFSGTCRLAIISPDETSVACTESSGKAREAIVVYTLANGARRVVFDGVTNEQVSAFGGLQWEPDGRHLLFVRMTGRPDDEREVMRVAAAGGASTAVGIAMEGLWDPTISPDGKTIVFRGGRGRSEAWLMEGLADAVKQAR